MPNAELNACWNVIRQKENAFLVAGYQPLSFINEYLTHFGLPLLPNLSIRPEVLSDISSAAPAFKALTDDMIFSLRNHIYTQTQLDSVDQWSEKLMRFCEINYHTLMKKSISKCHTRAAAQHQILHLACFFMDQSFSTKDLRFVNTALKLADLKGVLAKSVNLSALIEKNKNSNSVLLQFRLILTTEYVISQLRKR